MTCLPNQILRVALETYPYGYIQTYGRITDQSGIYRDGGTLTTDEAAKTVLALPDIMGDRRNFGTLVRLNLRTGRRCKERSAAFKKVPG